MTEIEAKVQLASREEAVDVMRKCKDAGARISRAVVQRDEYYDTRELGLQRSDTVFRIREVKGSCVFAIKLPRRYRNSGVYERAEIEVSVGDGHNLRKQFAGNGLVVAAVIEKRRRVARCHDAEVALDELPFLGLFVEVEAHSEAAVLRWLRRLGLGDRMRVTENYGELLEREVKRGKLRKRPELRATFAVFDASRVK